ncbi:MAG: hypothetical protein HY703_04995 [Gemmatimonadetes bacterium]|nr:hypothetical protein [Gemmatimonadota bacterium]
MGRLRIEVFRALVILLAVAAAGLASYTAAFLLALLQARGLVISMTATLEVVTALAAAALGIYVIARAPASGAARALSLFLVLVGLYEMFPLLNRYGWRWFQSMGGPLNPLFVLALSSLVSFTTVFPRHLTEAEVEAAPLLSRTFGTFSGLLLWLQRISVKPRSLAKLTLLVAAVFLAITLLAPWPGGWQSSQAYQILPYFEIHYRTRIAQLGPRSLNLGLLVAQLIAGAYALTVGLGVLLAMLNLRVAYGRGEAAEQARVFWLLRGLVMASVLVGVFVAAGVVSLQASYSLFLEIFGTVLLDLAFFAMVVFGYVAVFSTGSLRLLREQGGAAAEATGAPEPEIAF